MYLFTLGNGLSHLAAFWLSVAVFGCMGCSYVLRQREKVSRQCANGCCGSAQIDVTICGCSWMYLVVFGRIRMHLVVVECNRMYLDVFGCVWLGLYVGGCKWM